TLLPSVNICHNNNKSKNNYFSPPFVSNCGLTVCKHACGVVGGRWRPGEPSQCLLTLNKKVNKRSHSRRQCRGKLRLQSHCLASSHTVWPPASLSGLQPPLLHTISHPTHQF
ncbi:hypothetical protein OTU49_014107, partial [Cherax quadricarinatus]